MQFIQGILKARTWMQMRVCPSQVDFLQRNSCQVDWRQEVECGVPSSVVSAWTPELSVIRRQ